MGKIQAGELSRFYVSIVRKKTCALQCFSRGGSRTASTALSEPQMSTLEITDYEAL